MRKAAKRDQTEAAIVQALEQAGIVVYRVNQASMPDLLTYDRRARSIGLAGHQHWLPIECKAPGGSLTPAQEATMRLSPFPTVETPAEALELFGIALEPAQDATRAAQKRLRRPPEPRTDAEVGYPSPPRT